MTATRPVPRRVNEQLRQPAVGQLLARLRAADSGGLAGDFAGLAGEVHKQQAESKDNVKFLSTLERHFKVVQAAPFDQVREALPSMLNAIRMVWIVSRSFNSDEKLVPLMERVAGELTRRVATSVRVSAVLSLPGPEAAAAIGAAAGLLEAWEGTYLATRERINSAASSGQPWEFDRRRLFGKSRYMATVCADLLEVRKKRGQPRRPLSLSPPHPPPPPLAASSPLQTSRRVPQVATTLEQFLRFLSPEVKTIVGARAGEVDLMLAAVEELRAPFADLAFDVFDRAFKDSWAAAVGQFRLRVVDLEEMCKRFIETAFQVRRGRRGRRGASCAVERRGPLDARTFAPLACEGATLPPPPPIYF